MKQYLDEIWLQIIIDGMDPKINLWCSNYGRIKSFRTNKIDGKILKGAFISKYNVVFIKLIDGTSRTLYVHKLVAEFFLTPLNSKQSFVIHLDNNTTNNHYLNLQWADKYDVNSHRKNNSNTLKYNYARKLSVKDVAIIENKIKKLKNQGKPAYAPLARKYGISITHVRRIEERTNK